MQMPIANLLVGPKKYGILSLIWTLAVIVASNIPANNIPSGLPENSDIFIHIVWYGVMSFGWGKTFQNKYSNYILIVLVGSLSIGLINELLQEFLSLGRSFEFSDIISNTLGSFLGVILVIKKRR